jgi:hypothetical protein
MDPPPHDTFMKFTPGQVEAKRSKERDAYTWSKWKLKSKSICEGVAGGLYSFYTGAAWEQSYSTNLHYYYTSAAGFS